MQEKQFDLKKGIKSEDLLFMCPDTLIVLAFVIKYAKKNSLPLVVTNILGAFKQSVSKTHPQGRAFDVSVRSWSLEAIEACLIDITKKCGHLGAISYNTHKPRVAYHHNVGLGAHIHFQVYSTL